MKTWEERLALAEGLIGRLESIDWRALAPAWFVDQAAAAHRDAVSVHHRLADTLVALQPGRGWHRSETDEPSRPVSARLLAAWLGVKTYCPHLRKGSPQKVFVRLPLHRADCERCVGTSWKPPAGEDDRCDICERRGIEEFSAFAITYGALVFLGDACDECRSTFPEEDE
jgi:hypothetical protein